MLFILQNAAASCSAQEKTAQICQIGVAIASTAALTTAITAGLSAVIYFAVYKCIYKIKCQKQTGINPSEKSDMDETDVYESVREHDH